MARVNYLHSTIYLDLDISDAKEKIEALRKVHTDEEMKKLLRRAITRTGGRVKKIVSTDVPRKYHIKKQTVAADIGNPRMTNGGSVGVGCVIPIEGERHIIGGKTFPAVGGRHGWNGIKAGKRYKIAAQIVRGRRSVLPVVMERQGGNPPFRNLGANKLNNAAYARTAGVGFPPDNLPLARVVGLAVPQMPMNRAKDDVQGDIGEYLQKRLEAEHNFIINRCR